MGMITRGGMRFITYKSLEICNTAIALIQNFKKRMWYYSLYAVRKMLIGTMLFYYATNQARER